jgi:hypothetical protein
LYKEKIKEINSIEKKLELQKEENLKEEEMF